MKKKSIILLFMLLSLLSCSTISIGASNITYFYFSPMKIENPNIEMVSNEITIDTITSKIDNTILLQNISNEEIETDFIIPIDNPQFSIFSKDVKIELNEVEVNYLKKDDGNYIVKTKISANSAKKLHVEYYTENDLQKARLIKCNFDNLKGKKIKKIKVDVKIDEKNIPMVEKIYPGHYTFDNNTITVEYYNYEVNPITKDMIVKKETFDNLLYGRESELEEEERDIINKWYTNDSINIDKEKFDTDYSRKYSTGEEYKTYNKIVENILDYNYIKNGKVIYPNSYMNYEPSEPLLYEMYDGNPNASEERKLDLKGKNICIDFVETEGDKELYVSKVDNIQDGPDYPEPLITNKLVKQNERTILQTKGVNTGYAGKRGAKIIFVGQGIDGESLNATEQEKIAYINQINADMYIRIEIYDGELKKNPFDFMEDSGMVGYYDNNNLEIAKNFAVGKLGIKRENWNGQYEQYKTYDEYIKNYKNDYCKYCLIKLDNEDITNKSEIPTVVQFIGNRTTQDGKYVVEYNYKGFYDNSGRGLITSNAVLETSEAKNMLLANRQKNNNIKKENENKISSLKYSDDEKKIQDEIKQKLEEEKKRLEEEEKEKNKKEISLRPNDIIVFSAIVCGIFICIIILIVLKKKKKEKEDGEKINKN